MGAVASPGALRRSEPRPAPAPADVEALEARLLRAVGCAEVARVASRVSDDRPIESNAAPPRPPRRALPVRSDWARHTLGLPPRQTKPTHAVSASLVFATGAENENQGGVTEEASGAGSLNTKCAQPFESRALVSSQREAARPVRQVLAYHHHLPAARQHTPAATTTTSAQQQAAQAPSPTVATMLKPARAQIDQLNGPLPRRRDDPCQDTAVHGQSPSGFSSCTTGEELSTQWARMGRNDPAAGGVLSTHSPPATLGRWSRLQRTDSMEQFEDAHSSDQPVTTRTTSTLCLAPSFRKNADPGLTRSQSDIGGGANSARIELAHSGTRSYSDMSAYGTWSAKEKGKSLMLQVLHTAKGLRRHRWYPDDKLLPLLRPRGSSITTSNPSLLHPAPRPSLGREEEFFNHCKERPREAREEMVSSPAQQPEGDGVKEDALVERGQDRQARGAGGEEELDEDADGNRPPPPLQDYATPLDHLFLPGLPQDVQDSAPLVARRPLQVAGRMVPAERDQQLPAHDLPKTGGGWEGEGARGGGNLPTAAATRRPSLQVSAILEDFSPGPGPCGSCASQGPSQSPSKGRHCYITELELLSSTLSDTDISFSPPTASLGLQEDEAGKPASTSGAGTAGVSRGYLTQARLSSQFCSEQVSQNSLARPVLWAQLEVEVVSEAELLSCLYGGRGPSSTQNLDV